MYEVSNYPVNYLIHLIIFLIHLIHSLIICWYVTEHFFSRYFTFSDQEIQMNKILCQILSQKLDENKDWMIQ